MRHLRVLAAAILIAVLGTVCAFADVTPIPVMLVRSGAIYVIIAVIVIIAALILLRRSVKKRRSMICGRFPEEAYSGEAREESKGSVDPEDPR